MFVGMSGVCIGADVSVSAWVSCTTCSYLRLLSFVTRFVIVMCCVRVNGTSPGKIPMYILMSLANKLPCILDSLYPFRVLTKVFLQEKKSFYKNSNSNNNNNNSNKRKVNISLHCGLFNQSEPVWRSTDQSEPCWCPAAIRTSLLNWHSGYCL